MHKHTGYVLNAEVGMPSGVAELDENSALKEYQLPSTLRNYRAEIDVDVIVGQPIYVKESGHLGLALASNMQSQCIGVALEDTNSGYACSYAFFGAVSRDDWTLVTNAKLLRTGQTYYLDVTNAGMLTTIPPEIGYLIAVGIALSANTLSIQIQPSILL